MVRVTRVGQRLSTLDVRAVGDPATSPDQRAVLVVATPAVPFAGPNEVETLATEQCAEHRVAVPARETAPGHVSVRPDQDPAAAVSDEGVLAQHSRQRQVHVWSLPI